MLLIRWFLFAVAVSSTAYFWPHPWCAVSAFTAGMLFCGQLFNSFPQYFGDP